MTTLNFSESIVEALSYLKKFSGETILIKLGGSILNDPQLVKQLCHDISLLQVANIRFVLVHGGGKAINEVLDVYNIASVFQDGLRVTTDAMMDLIEMVLCGRVNQMLVRTLNAVGFAAIGLSGTDHRLFQCDYFNAEYGRVGKIIQVNTDVIIHYLTSQNNKQGGIIPVIAPVGIHENGEALNINADFAASECAVALGVKKIIYLTDQNGIYDDNKNIYSQLSLVHLQELIDNCVVTDGMLAKVNAIINALEQGVTQVHIINGNYKHALLTELLTDTGIGTVCQ